MEEQGACTYICAGGGGRGKRWVKVKDGQMGFDMRAVMSKCHVTQLGATTLSGRILPVHSSRYIYRVVGGHLAGRGLNNRVAAAAETVGEADGALPIHRQAGRQAGSQAGMQVLLTSLDCLHQAAAAKVHLGHTAAHDD